MVSHPRSLVRHAVSNARAVRLFLIADLYPISTEPLVPNSIESSHGVTLKESHWSQYLVRTLVTTMRRWLPAVQNSSELLSSTPSFAQ